MNKFAMAVATASLLLSTHSQAATVIQDTFWGAGIQGVLNSKTNASDPGRSGDVYDIALADPTNIVSKFDIDSVKVSLSNNMLSVVISSPLYFDSWLSKSIEDAPGDLFLSTTGWHPAGDADHYGLDDSTNGTIWNYVVDLSKISERNLSGTATLFSVNPNQVVNGYEGTRTAQEYGYSPKNDISVATGNWLYQIDEKGHYYSLSITMDLGNLIKAKSWDGISDLGFHWTMECGNDVVEGKISAVPLPSACLLLGSALVGLMGFARRRFR